MASGSFLNMLGAFPKVGGENRKPVGARPTPPPAPPLPYRPTRDGNRTLNALLDALAGKPAIACGVHAQHEPEPAPPTPRVNLPGWEPIPGFTVPCCPDNPAHARHCRHCGKAITGRA